MQQNTIIIGQNSIEESNTICLDICDLESSDQDNLIKIDYETLSGTEKIIFDNCLEMLKSKNV